MSSKYNSSDFIFSKDNSKDRIWQLEPKDPDKEQMGPMLISFDRKNILNLWTDYPDKFTPEQIEIFKEEMPFWYGFLKDRLKKNSK